MITVAATKLHVTEVALAESKGQGRKKRVGGDP